MYSMPVHPKIFIHFAKSLVILFIYVQFSIFNKSIYALVSAILIHFYQRFSICIIESGEMHNFSQYDC